MSAKLAVGITGGLLGGISFIVGIVFSFVYSEYSFDNNKFISELEYTFKATLITEFSIKPNCSKDEEILTLGKWEGSVEGCDCDNIKTKGSCSEDQKKKNCQTIPSKEPQEYKRINGNYICVKRSNDKYVDLVKNNQIIDINAQCPEGYITCGIIDTKDRILCLKTQSKCPINSTYITNIFNNNTDNTNETKNSFEYIISIFKLSEGQPCMNPNENDWHYYYDLEPDSTECKTEISGKIKDDKYESFTSTSKYQLYSENDIFFETQYEDALQNDTIYLYGRSFIGLNPDDFPYYSYDKLLSEQKLSNKSRNVMKIFSYITFGFLISPFIACFSGTADANGIAVIIYIAVVGFSLSLIVTFLAHYIICMIIYSCSYKIKSILTMNGGDSYLNELLYTLSNEQSKNMTFSLGIIIADSVAIFFGLIFLLCYFIQRGNSYSKTSLKEDWLD